MQQAESHWVASTCFGMGIAVDIFQIVANCLEDINCRIHTKTVSEHGA